MKPLISIIIPVYNSGKKINRLLKSLLNQTYTNIEIILVDDKSTDPKTIELKESWSKKDSRIKLFTEEKNTRGSRPRTDGILFSKGEFICFADQDDWYPHNAIEILYEACIRNHADMVIGSTSKALNIGSVCWEVNHRKDITKSDKVIQHEELMGYFFLSYFGVNILPISVWGKMFERHLLVNIIDELIEKSCIQTGAADLVMSMVIHPHINRLALVDDIVYYYNIGLPGASPKYLKRWLKNATNLFRLKWEMLEKYSYTKGKRTLAIEMVNYIKTYVSNCTIFDKANRDFHIKELQDTLNNPIWKHIEVLKGTEYREQQIVQDIITQNSENVYNEIEKRTLHAPFKIKLKHILLRIFAKIR